MNDLSREFESVKDKVRGLLDKQTSSGHHTFRRSKDLLAKYGIAFGGVSVIIAVVMIFFYLLYVVFPIFKSAEIEPKQEYTYQLDSTLMWGTEEYGEIAYQLNSNGDFIFFDTANGNVIENYSLELEPGESVTQVKYANREENLLVAGLSSGRILLLKQEFKLSYPNGERVITPNVLYPFGTEGIELQDVPVTAIAAAKNGETLSIVTADTEDKLTYITFSIQESFLSDEVTLEEDNRQEIESEIAVDYLLHDPTATWVYVISSQGELHSYWVEDSELISNERTSLVGSTVSVTDVEMLVGGISLIVGDSTGQISQWFPVRDENNTYRLNNIRNFEFSDSPVKDIYPEIRRKGFVALSQANELGLFYATSHRLALLEKIEGLADSAKVIINPRANFLMISSDSGVQTWQVENEHPDLSWSALWGKVWYESYPEPTYTWQSSASTTDFEAKFSLVPLSFGTLKAAFYAMLFAMPLAICGAIFTAYFMAPQMRSMVKPSVEIMEALPTVILGFLAGLWLAPLMEMNLPGVFLILILMPVLIVSFGYFWHRLPAEFTGRVPPGWQAALLIPLIIFGTWLCFELSYPVEKLLFDGDMPHWLDAEMGISYDQRNSMVVGIAMGFAVIPTIFSIAEDAIFSVPKHLSNGSLALGASQWQTLVRVVLPTASPGIFSAVMIGLGRAVGETMIVLMATGNTPIMEANIFEGMRTLSANIAVEMPESEVGSSHYRVLFLAGFVLFVFTFVFNTLAENIRHRLRRKYGSL
ncbi:ABC transporter permease subunit [Pleionea sediminis]|uniref:ABC transporter permease subunit n=1 Tax=Pleionea sediminis TaxID=2569479 RepID=UPI001185270F|nr:ABC transporter permease subunit [Pleionea sediminis]